MVHSIYPIVFSDHQIWPQTHLLPRGLRTTNHETELLKNHFLMMQFQVSIWAAKEIAPGPQDTRGHRCPNPDFLVLSYGRSESSDHFFLLKTVEGPQISRMRVCLIWGSEGLSKPEESHIIWPENFGVLGVLELLLWAKLGPDRPLCITSREEENV